MGIRLAAVCWLVLAAAACRPPAVEAVEGDFDYWVLALSWSPQHCASQRADTRRDPQCDGGHDFIVHGLWPQYDRGYPEFCDPQARGVPKPLVTRMMPLMPSERLIQHQWRKHGSCSGLPVDAYFERTERAWRSLRIPTPYRDAREYRNTTRADIEREFIQANPQLKAEHIAVQCSQRWLREVRICLDGELQPRSCGADVRDRCGREVVMRPARR